MEKLRRFIDARDMTDVEFAKVSGVSAPTICRILSGQTKTPTLPVILRIQDATAGFVSVTDWTAK